MSAVLLTYVALADRLKCSPEAAGSLEKRLGLPAQQGNDGELFFSIDLTDPLICLATVEAMDDGITAWLRRPDGCLAEDRPPSTQGARSLRVQQRGSCVPAGWRRASRRRRIYWAEKPAR